MTEGLPDLAATEEAAIPSLEAFCFGALFLRAKERMLRGNPIHITNNINILLTYVKWM